MNLIETIRARLNTLAPISLTIRDDSAQHAGHAGNTGGGHFHVVIQSNLFDGKNLVARHRLIYAQLQDLIPQQIHALSINALDSHAKDHNHI